MLISVLRFPVNLSGDCQISSVGNCLLRTRRGHWRGGRWRGKCQLGRCTNQRWCAKERTTKDMFLHSDFLTALTSSLIPLFFTIRKLALRANEKKYRELLTNQIVLYTHLTYVKPYQNILEQFWTNLKLWQIWLMEQSYLCIVLKVSYPFQPCSTIFFRFIW